MNILELAILKKMVGGGGGSGTDNYNDLSNLPQINGETLAGNKTAENLGLQDALTFDSAPTEDSTNPVESGGVYNALAGKQDNLTFDDDPTENSANPVKSGGVYNALAGKQDNLTFDGVYNASTNKAATESTVTNAIAGLDVSALSVDADETISSISETDGKISVTKQDIAIASNQVVSMAGYTKPSSAPATPAIQQGDTANAAFGKLEYKADVNQTNILYAIEKVGKNLVPLKNDVLTNNGVTITIEDSIVTVNGKSNSGLTTTTLATFTLKAGTYKISGGSDSATGADFFMRLGKAADDSYISYSASTSPVNEFTLASDTNVKLTILLNASVGQVTNVKFYPMICDKNIYDADPSFQPYGAPNYDLTYLQAEDRAALAEEIDAGAKNKFDISSATFDNFGNVFSITRSGSSATIKQVNPNTGLRLPGFVTYLDKGTYMLSGCPSGGGQSSYRLDVRSYSGGTVGDVISGSLDEGSGSEGFTITTAGNYFVCLRVASGYTVPTAGITVQPMICTKAAFGVSQKYVPYRLPYDELIGNTFSGTLSQDKIDNLPTGITGAGVPNNLISGIPEGWVIVHTYRVNNENTRKLQVVETMSGNTKRRTYENGAWSAWS